MRRTIAKFSLVAALAAGVTGCGMIGGGSEGTDETGQGQEAPADTDQDGPSDSGDGGGASDEEAEVSDASDAGGESSADTAGDQEQDSTAPVDGASGSATSLSSAETIAESTIEIDGSTLRFELKGVTTSDSGMTVHGILSNTGEETIQLNSDFFSMALVPDGVSSVGAASQLNELLVVDSSTGNVHSPAYLADGTCLCATNPGSGLEADQTMNVNTQYAALPADAETVTVSFGMLGSFENVPVTRS